MKSIDHAKHNESVCNYLGRNSAFGDWVITSAFYSAMHYVRHLMIPATIDGHTYTDFDSLFLSQKKMMEGRHGFMKDYVVRNFSEIGIYYCRLHDMSTTARYINYVFTREQSNMAKKYLGVIKEYVINKKPE